jgi:PEGA domain
VTGSPVPLFGTWARWYPWQSAGLGWNLGFIGYNPWRYSGTRWVFGRYGLWYDPWNPYGYYDPYYYDPYYGSYGYPASGRYADRDQSPAGPETGSIRLRVTPNTAQVYVDGTLVGVVDDFDGLRNHLELPAGTHQLELRANGYETYSAVLTVTPGKTTTERVNLQKK